MNILITGGTGLVGKSLVEKLRQKKHEVRILSRNKSNRDYEFQWNLEANFIDEKAFENLDCIIHLAGANISERWSASYKDELHSSRIATANLLREYCVKKNLKLKSLISASGINYYGTFTSHEILTEDSGIIQNDFLAKLSEDWEKAAKNFSTLADRVVCLRTAMVLAEEGGALPMLKNIVDYNLGSAIGSGNQWMNWIHIDDLVNMYVFAVENFGVNGSYNAAANDPVTNKNFMKKLAEKSGKFFLPINVPAFVMKIVFGEMSSIILEGTRASNEKIKSQGFDFHYKTLDQAFTDLV